MIVKLKIRTTWKILGKICLKTFRDFLNMWSTIKGDRVRHRGKGGNCNRRERFKVLDMRGLPSFSLLVRNPDPSLCLIYSLQSCWKKCERVFSFKATNLEPVELKTEKVWQNIWWCLNYRALCSKDLRTWLNLIWNQ